MEKLHTKKLLLPVLTVLILSLPGCRNVKANIQINPVVNFNALQASANETTPGYDVLGLAKYCSTYLRAPNLPGVSTLLSTFGDPLPCLKTKLQTGTLTTVQVDLMDATCWRNHACPPGTPSLTDWKVLKARADRVAKLANQFPTVNWWLSPWLEHDIKDESLVRKACGIIESSCLICKCINSPFSGAVPANIPVERHGTTVSGFSVSGDGSSSFDGDNINADGNNFQHRLSGSNQTYAWWNELNLRCTGEETFTPPLKRTARPEPWQFNLAAEIMSHAETPIPPAPPACKHIRVLSRGEIYKPLAESYCNGQPNEGDSRGNKPLLILRVPRQPGVLPLLRTTGQTAGSFRYYGTYTTPGLYRWYMGTGSGQNAWELYKALGSLQQEYGFLNLGKGECILVNSIRRGGVYR